MDLTCYSGGARLLIKLNRKKNGDVDPRFAVNGKLCAGWSTASQSNKAGTGILLWREE